MCFVLDWVCLKKYKIIFRRSWCLHTELFWQQIGTNFILKQLVVIGSAFYLDFPPQDLARNICVTEVYKATPTAHLVLGPPRIGLKKR